MFAGCVLEIPMFNYFNRIGESRHFRFRAIVKPTADHFTHSDAWTCSMKFNQNEKRTRNEMEIQIKFNSTPPHAWHWKFISIFYVMRVKLQEWQCWNFLSSCENCFPGAFYYSELISLEQMDLRVILIKPQTSSVSRSRKNWEFNLISVRSRSGKSWKI